MKHPRIVRRNKFELSLAIHDSTFIKTPAASQQNWLISRTMDELADDLTHLDELAVDLISGSDRKRIVGKWADSQAHYDDTQLLIEGQKVMQDWERPYMEAMAKIATETRGSVLEVGFGMGISASYIQAGGAASHTIIECNEGVKEHFQKWKLAYPNKDIRLVFGKWQDAIHNLGKFDAIFFDTYPLSEEEFGKYVIGDVTFAEHFFEAAAEHLEPGGVFTYYSNEIDSVARRHQRSLFKYFREITFSICAPLFPPKDCDYWWANSMIITKAVK